MSSQFPVSINENNIDLVIVGAGFFGATVAERCANVLEKNVLLIDRRNHIAGNAYTEIHSETGIEVHRYGPHIFHTTNKRVWDYVRQFSSFVETQQRIFTKHDGQIYPLPINLATMSQYFKRALNPSEARKLIASDSAIEPDASLNCLEGKAVSLVGRQLYEAFIRGYTQKQWQTDPKLLPADIITRLPVRYDFNSRYFSDTFEGLPSNGYTSLIANMISSDRIRVLLNTDYFEIRPQIPADIPIVYTGPIDRYFDFSEGRLGWRTLHFDWQTADVSNFQGTAIINYADEDIPYTRSTEYRHFLSDRWAGITQTVVAHELPRAAGTNDEPFYPINTPVDRSRYASYRSKARATPNVIFGGRLGSYRYLDMHQAIGAALKAFETQISPRLTQGRPFHTSHPQDETDSSAL